MGNRLSGLWCKKTATLHINNETKQQQQQQQQQRQQSEIVGDNSSAKNNKSHRKKSSGATAGGVGVGGGTGAGGTFRFGSARRLSLTSCVSKDKKSALKATTTNSHISTVEQQYQELLQQNSTSQPVDSQAESKSVQTATMKVNAQLPTVK
ncbi:hypothetical protein AWZ03_009434 [Drosophila navojoa]|uniref:Uncharacterized protein n=1 Tax=Drosophila navojoa TaxID=7232 RepID=A0A484B5M2_DRONA|nr:hypothetical protein AWZ03_009434 [Drosophila navojoa]